MRGGWRGGRGRGGGGNFGREGGYYGGMFRLLRKYFISCFVTYFIGCFMTLWFFGRGPLDKRQENIVAFC